MCHIPTPSMTTTIQTTKMRENETTTTKLIDANATAHDVVALVHLVSATTTFFEEDFDEDDTITPTRCKKKSRQLLGDSFFSDLEEKKKALRLSWEERDANGLTPMQVYALLGMNGRETFEAFFERAFSNPRSSGGGDDDDDDEATKKKSLEKK